MNDKKQEYIIYIEKLLPDLVRSALKIENINTTIVQIQTVMSDAPLPDKSITENNIIRDQILAWTEAFRLLKDNSFEITKPVLRHLHKIATQEQDYQAGQFRQMQVEITGTSYLPPVPSMLDEKWEKMLEDFKNQKTIEEKSTRLWGDIARNQFFNDGNKRLANLVSSCHQIQHCKPPILIPIEKQQALYQVLIDYYEKENYKNLHRFLIQHQMKLKNKDSILV